MNTVNYYLSENPLLERAVGLTATATAVGSLNKEEIISRALRLGTTFTRTDLIAAFNLIEETVINASLEGYQVNLPLFGTSFSISGLFDNMTDTFDEKRHKLNIKLSGGVLLREAGKQIKPVKKHKPIVRPKIEEVKDSSSEKVNECLTVRGLVKVSGYNIKIDGTDPSCGLWFVAENGAEVKAQTIIENEPKKIYAMVPELDAGNGTYQVKIVTQYTGSNLVKTPKVCVYHEHLTVINK
jgi:hypothetical protein